MHSSHDVWSCGAASSSPAADKHALHSNLMQTTPVVAGLGVAAAALVAKQALQVYVKWSAGAAARSFYKVGAQCTLLPQCAEQCA